MYVYMYVSYVYLLAGGEREREGFYIAQAG